MTPPIAEKLLNWYQKNARSFPWRAKPTPYRVWVSEIMAQQTRLETVLPYFERWMQVFPSIEALAAAPQQDVLVLWEGLGYYSRARNLHKAAQVVAAEHGGKLPQDAAALRKLPGIGRYTAGAIASLAFGKDEPLVDGNVKRVMARIFNVQEMVDTSAGEKRIWALAAEHLPPGRAADYNQALMELGALVCMPRNPACDTCPLAVACRAVELGLQAELPRKKPKKAVPHKEVTAAVMQEDGLVLIAQRRPDAMLGGLWEFPGGTREDGETLPACLRREIEEELGVQVSVGEQIGIYKHAYTHFKVTLHAFFCEIQTGEPRAIEAQDFKWISISQLPDYPMGKIDRQISKDLASQNGRGA